MVFVLKSQTVNDLNDERVWSVGYVDEHRVPRGDLDITIITSTRTEHPTSGTPDKLYSSLKYDQIHRVSGELARKFGFLVVKVHVVDPKTAEDILMGKKPILKGVTEASLSQIERGDGGEVSTMENRLRFQFTGCSYHHQKKQFAFVATYYSPNDLNEPLLSLTSASFHVFARKPTVVKPGVIPKPRGIHCKRKRESMEKDSMEGLVSTSTDEDEDDDNEPPRKVPRVVAASPSSIPSSPFSPLPSSSASSPMMVSPSVSPAMLPHDLVDPLSGFRDKLQELMRMKESLTSELQAEAREMIYSLLASDSDLVCHTQFSEVPIHNSSATMIDVSQLLLDGGLSTKDEEEDGEQPLPLDDYEMTGFHTEQQPKDGSSSDIPLTLSSTSSSPVLQPEDSCFDTSHSLFTPLLSLNHGCSSQSSNIFPLQGTSSQVLGLEAFDLSFFD